MRIVKPYGRSHVAGATEADGKPRRMLRKNDDPATSCDIVEFSHKHNPLVVAQWISVIDKIASKPKTAAGNKVKGPTTAQEHLRRVLGEAAWDYIGENRLLSVADSEDAAQKLHLIWKAKISPWGNARTAEEDDKGRPSAKGRWYVRFVGEVPPDKVTPDQARRIAADIHDHLYQAEKRKDPARRDRRQGLIEARSKSIAGNVLEPGDHVPWRWTPGDKEKYAELGDVAQKIYQAAQQELHSRSRSPQSNRARGIQNLSRDLAAKILYEHYANVFGASSSIRAAKDAHPGLFALHSAIKDCYQRFVHDCRKQDILRILPGDMPSLFRLVEAQYRNRDINTLIRLGKVIHYHSSEIGDGGQEGVTANWPDKDNIKTSRFWSSDGQTDIKRHEAFVRVWRHVIALASGTLHDWADPEGDKIKGDVLSSVQQAIAAETFNSDRYRQKCNVLFGARAKNFYGNEDFERSVLALAINGTAKLRHAIFHFKGRARFLTEMCGLSDWPPDPKVHNATANLMTRIADLWEDDEAGRDRQVIDSLRGVLAEHFLSESQCRDIIDSLTGGKARPGTVPLPRFRRVLTRHDHARPAQSRLPLPCCPNRTELAGNPWRLCQYSILKMLYDGPFRHWLEQRSGDELNCYIDQAIARTTRAAQVLNGRNLSNVEKDLITARAQDLPRLAKDETISNFLSRLSSATATEMRVQRGYAADAEAARKQAEFIGHLECDVIAPAFVDFIRDRGFTYIFSQNEQMPPPGIVTYDLSEIAFAGQRSPAPVRPWQQVLYFILHLVPVDDVGRLLHQIRKWQILENGDTRIADGILTVLSLYLDMHDAKFTGGDALSGAGNFAGFYENPDDFRIVFPLQTQDDNERRVPRRGLREILRFGHFPLLQRLAGEVRITRQQVRDWQQVQVADQTGMTSVAQLQSQRESLHEKAVKKTGSFNDADLRNYAVALCGVISHRHLAAHVNLTDLVRLHRMMMGVLGRLVDFAGLWERDFYFVLLALIHHHGLTPDTVLKSKGKKSLVNGQIVDAVRNMQAADVLKAFKDDLVQIFPHDKVIVDARNTLMHFNMLRDDRAPDLTECINLTRNLMGYDRKLKNAVSKSVREMLAREGMHVEWQMNGNDGEHKLGKAIVQVMQARHFQNGKVKVRCKLQGRDKRDNFVITESLHSSYLADRVARMFGGSARKKNDITDLIDFDDLFLDRKREEELTRNPRYNGHPKSKKKRGQKR